MKSDGLAWGWDFQRNNHEVLGHIFYIVSQDSCCVSFHVSCIFLAMKHELACGISCYSNFANSCVSKWH